MKFRRRSGYELLIYGIIFFSCLPIFMYGFFAFGTIFLIIGIASPLIITNSKKKKTKVKDLYNVNDEELISFIPNFDKKLFEKNILENYTKVQKLLNDDNYTPLSKYCTESMIKKYIQYEDRLKEKGQKNYIENIELISFSIPVVKKKDDAIKITIRLATSCYDYTLSNNEVVGGSKEKQTIYNLELDYLLPIGSKNLKCSSCGAPLEGLYDNHCDYCNSSVYEDEHEYILNDERVISKKMKA